MTTSTPTGQAETQREALPTDDEIKTALFAYEGALGEEEDDTGLMNARDALLDVLKRLRRAALATAAPASKPPAAVSEREARDIAWSLYRFPLNANVSREVGWDDGFTRGWKAAIATAAPVSDDRIDCLLRDMSEVSKYCGYDGLPLNTPEAVESFRSGVRALLAESGAPATHEARAGGEQEVRAVASQAWRKDFDRLLAALIGLHITRDTSRGHAMWEQDVRAAYATLLAHCDPFNGNRDSHVPESTPAGAEVQGRAGAWQPIETAPTTKDVLLLTPDGGVTYGGWLDEAHEPGCPWSPRDTGWWSVSGQDEFTHWMPLPRPPIAQPEREGDSQEGATSAAERGR